MPITLNYEKRFEDQAFPFKESKNKIGEVVGMFRDRPTTHGKVFINYGKAFSLKELLAAEGVA